MAAKEFLVSILKWTVRWGFDQIGCRLNWKHTRIGSAHDRNSKKKWNRICSIAVNSTTTVPTLRRSYCTCLRGRALSYPTNCIFGNTLTRGVRRPANATRGSLSPRHQDITSSSHNISQSLHICLRYSTRNTTNRHTQQLIKLFSGVFLLLLLSGVPIQFSYFCANICFGYSGFFSLDVAVSLHVRTYFTFSGSIQFVCLLPTGGPKNPEQLPNAPASIWKSSHVDDVWVMDVSRVRRANLYIFYYAFCASIRYVNK